MVNAFVSWSGSRSKELARAVSDFFPRVIQAVNPWFSDTGIEKGSLSMTELFDRLADIDFGFICITAENVREPWPHFEAGALAKNVRETARVVPVLLDFAPADLRGPLAQLQAVHALDADQLFPVAKQLNAVCAQPLEDEFLRESFDTHWDRYVEVVREIEPPTEAHDGPSLDDQVDEIVSTLRRVERGVFTRFRVPSALSDEWDVLTDHQQATLLEMYRTFVAVSAKAEEEADDAEGQQIEQAIVRARQRAEGRKGLPEAADLT